MRNYLDYKIIGVDAGFGNMKSASTIFPTGLTAMDHKPIFEGDILEMNGTWYRIGEGHKAYNPDKTSDEEFYILTLASIACELKYNGLTEAKVHLALGLPTTWTGRQREDYRQYMMRKREVAYVFNDVLYRISFVDCSIFPQGYAAMVRIIDDDKRNNSFAGFAGTVMMADIGNGTMNIMQLQNGRPDEKHCWTEVLGVNQCVLTAKKQMMDKYGIDLPEQTIENYLRTGQARLRQEYANQRKYATYHRKWTSLSGAAKDNFAKQHEFELRKYREAEAALSTWTDNGSKIDIKALNEVLAYLRKEEFMLNWELDSRKTNIRRLEIVKREFVKGRKEKGRYEAR